MELITGNITIKHILQHNNNWERFYSKHKHRIRESIVENIEKLLLCRTQELGFHKYQCPHCGEFLTVPHSCKSRICSSCGKLATDRWISANLPQFPNVSYQHLVFTLPEELRPLILLNRRPFLNALFKYAAFTVRIWAVTDRRYIPGIVMVLHTFGRDLKFNPHIHMLVTCGGLSCDYSAWIDNSFIPHQALKSIWRYHIVSFIRNSLKKKALALPLFLRRNPNSFLNAIYSKIWYVSLGRKLSDASFTITYIGRYTKRPVIAESRIVEYDGSFVLFHYKDQVASRTLHVRLAVDEFIARLIRHIPDKGFRQIRYAGIFAPRVRSKLIPRVKSMFKNIRKSVNIFMSNLRTYSSEMPHCPRCGCEMILISISNHGKYFQISETYISHPP
jgi:hypothetical protein